MDASLQGMCRRKAHGMWPVAMVYVDLLVAEPGNYRPAHTPYYFVAEKL
jgi:hypothetical protein